MSCGAIYQDSGIRGFSTLRVHPQHAAERGKGNEFGQSWPLKVASGMWIN